MQSARGEGKLWGYGVVEGGIKQGKSVMPELLSLSWHMDPSLVLRNPILGSHPGIPKEKEGRDNVYYDEIFPCVTTELTAYLFSEFLITDPSDLILLTAPVGSTGAQR